MSLQKQFSEFGIHHKKDGCTMHLETGLHGIEKLLANRFSLSWERSENKDDMTSSTFLDDKERNKFCGGSTQKLLDILSHGPDMHDFEKALAEFKRSGVTREIATRLQDITPKRKRRFSEHDGEWDHDRRFEISPFQATTKILSPSRVLTIVADFSISAYATAEEINKYGALVWAVSQLIESSGIQTEILWHMHSNYISEGDRIDCDISILVKKPGQYLAPSQLAAVFSSLFFRRAGFALITASADLANKICSYGKGTPKQHPKAAEFTEGKLHLTPQVSHGYTDALKDEILKAIKGTK